MQAKKLMKLINENNGHDCFITFYNDFLEFVKYISKEWAGITPEVAIFFVNAARRVAFLDYGFYQGHQVFLAQLALSVCVVLVK